MFYWRGDGVSDGAITWTQGSCLQSNVLSGSRAELPQESVTAARPQGLDCFPGKPDGEVLFLKAD